MESGSEAHIMTDPVSSAACPKCGAMLDVKGLTAFTAVQCPTCEFEFQVPARFGAFMLLQLLGAGGMGGVYRARDEGLNREVAIKVMLKSLGDDPQFVETFQREAQAAAKLNHPNIAQIYSFGQVHGQPFIVMELVSGGSLDKMMATQGPLEPSAVIHIGAQIAEGLREAAEAGLVHGDVKPENILFDSDKNAKLVDFGLAAMNGGPGNDVWGTPYYIAPEKVRRQKADFRSDIYSLGATLYHAIAGVPPFDGADATAVVKARFDGPPKPLKDLRGNVPDDVDSLVSRMLEVEPQMRYPTYGSLLGDMRRYLSKVGPVQIGVNTKKIMIKGKTPKATTGVTVTTGVIGELPSGMVPVEAILEEQETDEAAGKRRLKMIAWVVGGIVLTTLVVGGGIWGVKSHLHAKDVQAQRAQIAKTQTSAKALIAKSVGKAKTTVERIRADVPNALECAKAGADAVVAALGEDVRASLVPPEPEYVLPKPPAEAPAAAGVASPVAGATNQVAGATNQVAAVSKAVAAVSNAAPAQAEAPVAAPAPEPAAGGDANPVVATVRGMYESAYAVKAASLMADQLLSEVEDQAKAAESLMGPSQVQALIKAANAIVDKVNSLTYAREIADVPHKVLQLKKTLESVKAETASLADKRRQEMQDKKRKADDEAVAEKKRLELEAHKQKVQTECESVAAKELEAVAPLKQLQFRDALRLLKDLSDGLETKEGLAALETATDRINRVKEFHTYLVEKVPGFKSSRGWSVDGADQKMLSVAGKKVQWVEVYSSRLDIVAELINGLVKDEQATKSLRLREKTRLVTNAALCLNLFYKDMPSAQEFAKNLATSAAQHFDVDADVIKRLLPAFFTE